MTYVREYTPKRWIVKRSESDEQHCGIVECHDFYTYTKAGKRVSRRFWLGRLSNAGHRQGGRRKCKTKREAVEYVLEASRVKYRDRRNDWKPGARSSPR